jgi:hypothetical protein
MKYLLLIYSEESTAPPPQDEIDASMAEWYGYTKAIKDSGVHLAGEALQPSQTATTVRLKGDERGFYLIDVPDLDTALDWAARCPGAKYGSMEVRPVMEFDA